MKNERRKRWLYAVSGFLIMLVSGDIYAWNVFSASIARTFPAWENSQLSLVFTIALISFCIASLAAGFLGGIRSRWFIWAAAALFLGG